MAQLGDSARGDVGVVLDGEVGGSDCRDDPAEPGRGDLGVSCVDDGGASGNREVEDQITVGDVCLGRAAQGDALGLVSTERRFAGAESLQLPGGSVRDDRRSARSGGRGRVRAADEHEHVDGCALESLGPDSAGDHEGDGLAVQEVAASLELHDRRLRGVEECVGWCNNYIARRQRRIDVGHDDPGRQLRLDDGVAAFACLGGAGHVDAPGKCLIVANGGGVARGHLDGQRAHVLGVCGHRRQHGRRDHEGHHECKHGTEARGETGHTLKIGRTVGPSVGRWPSNAEQYHPGQVWHTEADLGQGFNLQSRFIPH